MRCGAEFYTIFRHSESSKQLQKEDKTNARRIKMAKKKLLT